MTHGLCVLGCTIATFFITRPNSLFFFCYFIRNQWVICLSSPFLVCPSTLVSWFTEIIFLPGYYWASLPYCTTPSVTKIRWPSSLVRFCFLVCLLIWLWMMPLQFVSDLVTHWFTSSCYNFQYQNTIITCVCHWWSVLSPYIFLCYIAIALQPTS